MKNERFSGQLLRDITIGMIDGLTVTFALASGFSAVASYLTRLVLLAGAIQIVAGAIAMGLGGYFAVKNEVAENRPRKSGFFIGISYAIGGLISLASYFFTDDAITGLKYSAVITIVCLLILGYFKSRFVGVKPFQGAVTTTLIGIIAAACAYGIAKLIIGI